MPFTNLGSLQKKEISEVLERFGLKDGDRRVYLALLPLGETTLTPLARAAALPPTTVQSIMARLVEMGLVKLSKRGSRGVYEAHDPLILRRLLERQSEEVAGIVPLLQKLQAEKAAEPVIKVYYRERMTDVFHQALAAKDKLLYEIVAAKDLQDILGERFHFTRRRVKNGIHLKSLRVESREIKRYSTAAHARELREAKFLPKEMTFRASLMLWDDMVAFFSTEDEGLAWTVKSQAVSAFMRQVFDLLWSISRRMETA